MYLYIRHAEQIDPRSDSGVLHPEMIPTAEAYGRKPDVIISSPYVRCRETAERLGHIDYIDARIGEFSFNRKWPRIVRSDTAQYKPALIETEADFSHRVLQQINDVVKTFPNSYVLIVTHGAVIRELGRLAFGPAILSIWPRPRDVPHLGGLRFVR
jgi:broad specificity phosphatase PhoE